MFIGFVIVSMLSYGDRTDERGTGGGISGVFNVKSIERNQDYLELCGFNTMRFLISQVRS